MDEIAIKEEQLMIEEKDIKVGFPKEVWRTISNFTDYEISNIARVRNKKTGLIKVPSVGKGGYLVFVND